MAHDGRRIACRPRSLPRSPGWYHKLKANPDIEITFGSDRFAVTAHPVLPDSLDYARLWKLVNKNNADRYVEYQKKLRGRFQ